MWRQALQLPSAEKLNVCRAVRAATEEVLSCHRFVGVDFEMLRMMCGAGDVEEVRECMEQMAAGRYSRN